jgi:hypothetical protein
VPLVVYVLLIDPLTAYLGGRWKTMPLGPRAMEVSVLWFVAALLAFSLAYAAVRRVRLTSANDGPAILKAPLAGPEL